MSQIQVDNIYNKEGDGSPGFPLGAVVTGVVTATTFKGGAEITSGTISATSVTAASGTFNGPVTIGGTLTYEDVTNIDSVGVITARNGINITGGALDLGDGNIDSVGEIALDTIKPDNGVDVTLNMGTDKNMSLRGNIGEIGDVTGFQATNDAQSALTDFGIRATTIRLATGSAERLRVTANGVDVTGQQTSNVTAVSGTAIDCSLGNHFTKTITGATAFTFTNVPASGTEYSFTLEVTLNGSNAITWPASVKWNADTAPTITDGKTQLFMFLTTNGGTRWRGSALVDYVN